MINKIIKRIILTSTCLCLIIATVPQNAIASTNNTLSPKRIVVSMGDSYSSGEGVEDFYGQDKTLSEKVKDQDWLAHRSQESWPGKLSVPGIDGILKDNKDSQWYFLASSGATSDNLYNAQEKEYWITFYRNGRGTIEPQLDSLKNIEQEASKNGDSIAYVTMTIGGNDIGFSDIIELAVITPSCICPNVINNKLSKTLKTFKEEGYKKILKAYSDTCDIVQNETHVIIAGYPKLFANHPVSSCVIHETEAKTINRYTITFNKELEKLVEETNNKYNGKICFVDVVDEFGDNGAYSEDPYINPIYLGNKDQDINLKKVSSSYSMHPNEKGLVAYANCVQKKIKELESQNPYVAPTLKNYELDDVFSEINGDFYGFFGNSTSSHSLIFNNQNNFTYTYQNSINESGSIDGNEYNSVVELSQESGKTVAIGKEGSIYHFKTTNVQSIIEDSTTISYGTLQKHISNVKFNNCEWTLYKVQDLSDDEWNNLTANAHKDYPSDYTGETTEDKLVKDDYNWLLIEDSQNLCFLQGRE